jgi:hypothetical protein
LRFYYPLGALPARGKSTFFPRHFGLCGPPLAIISSNSVKSHGTMGSFGVPSGSYEGRFKATI